MSLFQENLAKWATLIPERPDVIKAIENLNPVSISFSTSDNGMPNLVLATPEGQIYLHSTVDPLEEAKAWFLSLYLNRVQVLYVYGLGLGYYYEAAKDWLKEDKNRYLVFLEDEPEIVHRFLETARCKEMLESPQVYLHFIGPRQEQLTEFTNLTSLFSALNHLYIGLKSYEMTKPTSFNEFRSTLSFLTTMHRMIYSEAAGHGLVFFRNFYLNFLNLPRSYFANGLLGKFKGVPAIICGAGPSLNKNIGVLSTLSDRALIFAGGTALNALNGKGVMPHFGVGIDPNPDQFTRLVMNHAFELPFIYRCRMLHEALDIMHGDRLYLTGTGGYAIGEWFEKQLGIHEPELGEGFNVLNFSVVIAHAMGCNPIICTGIDLAYSGGESYAEGVASHPVHSRKSNFRTKSVDDELICKNDIYGKPVNTLWKWMAESLWYTHFADSHPECKVINATEGGIGFLNVENMTLEEVKEQYLDKQWDLKSRLHGEIRNSLLPQSYNDKKICSLAESLRDSLSKCADRCQSLLRMAANEAQNPLSDENYQEKLKQEEKLLSEELAFDIVMKRFNIDYVKRNELDHKRLEADKPQISEKEYASLKALLEFDRYRFLQDTALLNIDVINMILEKHKQLSVQNSAKASEIDAIAHQIRQRYPIPVPTQGEEYFFSEQEYKIKDPEWQLNYHEIFREENKLSKQSLTYPSGKLKLETYYSDGKLHGPSTFYSEQGTILCRAWFIHGKQSGKMWSYHADGSLHSLQIFQDGLPVGIHQYFYAGGQPKSILPYKQGVLHGEVSLFHPNGTMARQLSFVEGKKNGTERIWNSEGQLIIESTYEADRPVGQSRLWHWNGVLAKEVLYDENFNQIMTKEWDMSGTLIEEEEMDYFDQMNAETHHLTSSLEKMVQEMTNLTPIMSDQMQFKTPSQTNDLSEELANLQKEMQHLQALDILLKEQIALEEDGKEAIWKTKEYRREMEKQFEGIKDKINTDISGIGEGIKKIIEKLVDNKE